MQDKKIEIDPETLENLLNFMELSAFEMVDYVAEIKANFLPADGDLSL